MLSNPAGYSIVTPWEKVLQYNPEVLVVAPCGFNVERASKEIEKLTQLEGWNELKAVKTMLFTSQMPIYILVQHPLVDGIELLAIYFIRIFSLLMKSSEASVYNFIRLRNARNVLRILRVLHPTAGAGNYPG